MTRFCTETDNINLIVNSGGDRYQLNDRSTWRLMAYSRGLSNIRRLSQRYPGQDGRTDLGGIIDERYLELAFMVSGVTVSDLDTKLEEAAQIFRRRDNDPLEFIFNKPNGETRAIKGNLDGELMFAYGDRAHKRQRFSTIIVCSDYRFYDPDLQSVSFSRGASIQGILVPTPVPTPVGGTSSLRMTQTISYAGGSKLASKEFPVITIYGPITDPLIRNLTTNEKIDLSANGGISINLGEFLTIDLSGQPRRDSKTIRDQDGNSQADKLTTDSDLSTWHLSYNTELLSDGSRSIGDNEIKVTGTNITDDTLVTINYYNRYEAL